MKWSPSLRAKFVFFGLASLVLLGFCVTLATLYAVNARKREIVDGARDLVRARAEQFSDHLARLLDEEKAPNLAALRESARFRQAVQFVITAREDHRVLAYVIYDQQGRVEYTINPDVAGDLEVEATVTSGIQLAEARHTILHNNEPKGMVEVKYLPTVLLNRIQDESRQITSSLLTLAAVLTALLALIFVLLWRLFQRHLEREHVHEQLDRMAYVGTLASGLAHEIRNPLNALRLNLDVVREEMSDPGSDSPERTRSILDLLDGEIQRLNSTLTNFLQFAQPSRGRMQMTDIVAVMQETAALLEPNMRQARVAYQFRGERSCMTQADPAALRQLFWNVLLNAIQAVEDRDDRRIEAHCRVEDGQCHIQVRDSGPGVPPGQREKVFEVFSSTRPGGFGFGLAIARQIVGRHGGTMRVDSLDGWGCVMNIQLPLRVEAPSESGKRNRT
jgi:signal transduction histidine kinase